MKKMFGTVHFLVLRLSAAKDNSTLHTMKFIENIRDRIYDIKYGTKTK